MGNICFEAPDSPKGKSNRRAFFCIGLVLWALALVCCYHARQIRALPTTEAVVSSVLRGMKTTVVYVQYEVDGQSYTSVYNGSKTKNKFLRTEDRVRIAYDPDCPEQIYAEDNILSFITAFFFLFGLALFLISRYPQRAIRSVAVRVKAGKTLK